MKQRCVLLVLVSLVVHGAMSGQDVVSMVKRVKPSVVTVVPKNAFGLDEGSGSGFFIERTRIVTNYHVVDGASSVKVRLNDSTELDARHIVAQDSATDLAILEIDVPAGRSIVPLSLQLRDPEQGERVYVVGNPLGFEQSVSDGIVSSVRTVKDEGKRIQFTAAISAGNSGSPLLDAAGNVYGVAQYIVWNGQNLNFAIPSERIKALSIGEPIAFLPTMKEYDGVMMPITEAFVVDTTLFGDPPSHLSMKEQNVWRLRNAALRLRWQPEVVDKQMNRLMRAIKRNFPSFDAETDTLSMTWAHGIIVESLGYNTSDLTYPPEMQAKIDGVKYALGIAMARMALSDEASPVATTAGAIDISGQIWQEFEKDASYIVVGSADTTEIEDLDLAVFQRDGDGWKAVAADTRTFSHAMASFTAPVTAEYAVVFRVAKRKTPGQRGVFGGAIFRY